MNNLVPFQPTLRQLRTAVVGNRDYAFLCSILERINAIIDTCKLDLPLIQYALDQAAREEAQAAKREQRSVRSFNAIERARMQRAACQALRCNLGRRLTGESFRDFSVHIAESELWQWFCEIENVPVVRAPSKSALERFDKMFPAAIIRDLVATILRQAGLPAAENETQALGLAKEIDLSGLWIDLTCVPADLHFPVDWVLLRDAVRTLMKAVAVIRKHGLRSRMDEPQTFLRAINKMSMEMTQCRRRPDSKRRQKRILRRMKKLTKVVAGHGGRYRALLAENWRETDLSQKQAACILKRIDNILAQVPAAIRQAHERIIGGRLVKNEDKILSLYDPDLHVIVRGKAGAAVEYGNTLLLAEQAEGLIVDWQLYREIAPADSLTIKPCVERYQQSFGSYPKFVVGDRGCDGPDSRDFLAANHVEDFLCPRSVRQLNRRLQEEVFQARQKRRAQTEARIGIFKNDFLGRPLRSKGIAHRLQSIGWSVLAHDLWVLARLPQATAQQKAA